MSVTMLSVGYSWATEDFMFHMMCSCYKSFFDIDCKLYSWKLKQSYEMYFPLLILISLPIPCDDTFSHFGVLLFNED